MHECWGKALPVQQKLNGTPQTAQKKTRLKEKLHQKNVSFQRPTWAMERKWWYCEGVLTCPGKQDKKNYSYRSRNKCLHRGRRAGAPLWWLTRRWILLRDRTLTWMMGSHPHRSKGQFLQLCHMTLSPAPSGDEQQVLSLFILIRDLTVSPD